MILKERIAQDLNEALKARVVVGNSIWFATEYINQSCDLATYEAGFGPSFGSCGGTRASLGNWATRITEVTP